MMVVYLFRVDVLLLQLSVFCFLDSLPPFTTDTVDSVGPVICTHEVLILSITHI